MAGSKEGGMDGGDVVIKETLLSFGLILIIMEYLLRRELMMSSGLFDAMID